MLRDNFAMGGPLILIQTSPLLHGELAANFHNNLQTGIISKTS